MCPTPLMQHFDLVSIFALTLTLTLYFKVHTYLLHSSFLGQSLGKVWLAAAIGPVSVADKEKSDDFDLLT